MKSNFRSFENINIWITIKQTMKYDFAESILKGTKQLLFWILWNYVTLKNNKNKKISWDKRKEEQKMYQ